MPLNAPGLKSDLTALMADPPPTAAECATAWADAVEAYASGIVPPSTTVSSARGALESALAAAFATPAAAAAMEAAFAAFATTVGSGMAGFTPTPPPAPVGFAAGFLPPFPETHSDAGDKYGQLIDDWLTTGSSALIAPPNTVVPWS